MTIDSEFVDYTPSGIGAVTRTVELRLEERRSVKDFGAVGDGVTDDTGKINAGIAWINAGQFRTLWFPEGNYRITAALTTIARSDSTIVGYGARLTATGSSGKVWVVGGTGTEANRVRILGFEYNFTGSPGANDFLLDLVQTADSAFCDFVVLNAACLVRYGGDVLTDACTRVLMRNWTGNFNKGDTADANILIRNGSACRFIDFHFTGQGGGNSATKAIVKFHPISGVPLDTFWFISCSFQAFSIKTPIASADGKAYGVYIDRTNGDITNLWFLHCVFDHTTTAAFYFKGGGSAVTSPYDRNINLVFNRFATDNGKGIVIDFETVATPNLDVRGLTILGNKIIISAENRSGIEVRGIGAIEGLDCSFNHIEDDTSTSKQYAVIFNCGRSRRSGIGSATPRTGRQDGKLRSASTTPALTTSSSRAILLRTFQA